MVFTGLLDRRVRLEGVLRFAPPRAMHYTQRTFRLRAPQQLVFTPYHADGIYKIGDTVGWTVTPSPAPPTYAFKWTIRRNNAVVL